MILNWIKQRLKFRMVRKELNQWNVNLAVRLASAQGVARENILKGIKEINEALK